MRALSSKGVAAPPPDPRGADPSNSTAASSSSRPPVAATLPLLRRRPPHPSLMDTRIRKRFRASEHSATLILADQYTPSENKRKLNQ